MSAGHFGGNLLFRINFRAGFSRHSRLVSPRCYFSSIFCFLFVCSQDMTFSKQVLIKHFVSATERGPLSLKKVLTLFCDSRAQFWGIWQGLLHEEPQRKALYIYPFVKFFFFFCYSQIFLSAYLGLSRLSRLLPPSHFLISSPRALWCAVKVNLGLMSAPLMSMQHTANDNKTNSAFSLHRDINLPWSWFGSNRPDRWPIKSASQPRSEKNKLKSARPCIPLQNQYLSGDSVTPLLTRNHPRKVLLSQ